jgi:Transglycosylase SLT domain
MSFIMRCLLSYRLFRVAVVLMVAALPCFAGEVAVLKNGFSIRHERREIVGDVTRLYVNADGSSYVDVATADIEHFEAAPSLPVTPAAFANAKGAAPRTSPFFPAGQQPGTLNVQPTVDLNQVVSAASARYRLDPDFVSSVIKAESGFNVRAVSPKGAQGLMQLMPGTASQLGVRNAFDPQANVEGGTRYLRELLERYNFDLVKALAAYNAGPQRVEQFGGVPPYYETRAYVARVVRDFNKKKIAQGKAAPSQKAAAAKTTSTKTSQSRASSSKPGGTHAAGSSPIAQAKATAAQPHD